MRHHTQICLGSLTYSKVRVLDVQNLKIKEMMIL